MIKKIIHILVIFILALNLTGALAFAAVLDCGMECCKPGDWAGTTSFEAPSCCQMDDVTCGFEAGRYEEILDTAICCFTGVQKLSSGWEVAVSSGLFSLSPTLRFPPSEVSTPPLQPTPLYLSNASFLC